MGRNLSWFVGEVKGISVSRRQRAFPLRQLSEDIFEEAKTRKRNPTKIHADRRYERTSTSYTNVLRPPILSFRRFISPNLIHCIPFLPYRIHSPSLSFPHPNPVLTPYWICLILSALTSVARDPINPWYHFSQASKKSGIFVRQFPVLIFAEVGLPVLNCGAKGSFVFPALINDVHHVKMPQPKDWDMG